MTGSLSIFSKKYQNLLEKNLVARGSEFQRFMTWARVEAVDTPHALLGTLVHLEENNPSQASVIGALIAGTREPLTASFCSDVLCWAFAKRIRSKVGQVGRAKEDAGQACIVGLLEATQSNKENPSPVEVNVIRRLYDGIDAGLKSMKKQERSAFVAYGAALQRGAMLQGAEAAGRRARAQSRIRFDEQERETALEYLRIWSGELIDREHFYDAWDAIVLKGEPIKEFLKRSANSDATSTRRDWNRVSGSKRRAQERLQTSIGSSPAAREVMHRLEVSNLLAEAGGDSGRRLRPSHGTGSAFGEHRLWKREDHKRLKQSGS